VSQVIDKKAARIIGQEIGRVMLKASAKMMRLDVAEALYGPSESTLMAATKLSGKERLVVKRRRLPGASRRMILVHRDEMERWIKDNFEEDQEVLNESTPTDESDDVQGKYERSNASNTGNTSVQN